MTVAVEHSSCATALAVDRRTDVIEAMSGNPARTTGCTDSMVNPFRSA
jgi:hypothetical protein